MMERESRIKKSFLNFGMNILTYSVALGVAFFSRRIFLDKLGANFLGLSETVGSILGFLNIAEFGFGTAISVVLYKPLFQKDYSAIKELVSLQGFLYRWVGFLILMVGIIVSFFLPKIFDDTPFSNEVIYVCFYTYLASSVAGYFFNYKSILLSADQRNYLVTGYFQLTNILRVIVQVLLCIYVNSFILFFLIQFLFSIINIIILNICINRHYPWLQTNLSGGLELLKKYPDVYKKSGQVLIHQLGGTVRSQIIPVLIYKYVSLATVALYSNFTVVSFKVKAIFSMAFDGMGASVGNLVAEGDNDKSYDIFKQLFSLRALFAGVISVSTYYLIIPFISLWLGSEYLLSPIIPIIVALQMYLEMMYVYGVFVHGFGLFSDVWVPIVELVFAVVGTIIGGYFGGLPGVLLGAMIPQMAIAHLWKPYYLFTRGFHRPVFSCYFLFVKYLLLLLCSAHLTVLLTRHIVTIEMMSSGWGFWVAGALLFSVVIFVLYFILLYISSPELREAIKRIKFFIHR